MRISRKGVGGIILSNEQMRISRQGDGWVEIISSNEQMRISRQGVVKQEYSKREDEMFSSGGWWEWFLKNWFNSKKSFFQARLFSLLNEKLVAKKDSAARASCDTGMLADYCNIIYRQVAMRYW